jgi:hypothetical protein
MERQFSSALNARVRVVRAIQKKGLRIREMGVSRKTEVSALTKVLLVIDRSSARLA